MDFVGQFGRQNPAWRTEIKREPATLNGEYYRPGSLILGRGYSNYAYEESPAINHIYDYSLPNDTVLATQGFAMANPANSRHDIGLPVSLIELRELPKLIKSVFDLGPKRIASAYVEYSFGYAPLISDIRKLFSFPATVEARIAELNGIVNRDSVSRTRVPYSREIRDDLTGSNISFPTSYNAHMSTSRETKIDVRVTSNWRVRDEIKSLSDPEKAKLARRLVLGLSAQAMLTHAWDLLPWSWCVDYFTTFGDFLSLSNNEVAILSGPGCISTVKTTTLRQKFSNNGESNPTWINTLRYTDGWHRRRDWTRSISLPGLSLTGPFLTGHQTSILGSIYLGKKSPE